MSNSKYSSGEKQWNFEDEIQKNEKLRKEDVDELKDFCLTIPKVDESLTTNQVLVALLHSSNYELESACSVATKYFNTRLSLPQLFTDRDLDSEELQDIFEFGFWCALPRLTPQGFRVILSSIRQPDDASLFRQEPALKATLLICDACIHDAPTTPGFIYIYDFNKFSWTILWKFDLFLQKKVASYAEEGSPVIMKEVHFINVSNLAFKALSLIKPLFSKRIRDTFQFHADTSSEEFLQSVPKECLPSDYGGLLPDVETLRIEHMEWLRRMQQKMNNTSTS